MTHTNLPRSTQLFGVADLIAAALYVFTFIWLVPSRSALFTTIVLALSAILAAAGLGLVLRAPWGPRLARVASALWLLAFFVLLALLVASAAYLHGIYGGIGQAGAAMALLMAVLSFQLVGLLPALQLLHLRRVTREARQ